MIDRDALLDTMAAAFTKHLEGVKNHAPTIGCFDLLTEPTEWRLDGWVPKRRAMEAILLAVSTELYRLGMLSIDNAVLIGTGQPIDAGGPIDAFLGIASATPMAKDVDLHKVAEAAEYSQQIVETRFGWTRSTDSDMLYFLTIDAQDVGLQPQQTGIYIEQVESAWLLKDGPGEAIYEIPFTDRDSRLAAFQVAMEQGRKVYLGVQADLAAETPVPARQSFLDFWLQRPTGPAVIEIDGKRHAVAQDPLFHLAEAISEFLESGR